MPTNIIDKFVENIIIFNFEYKELDKNYLRNKILFLIGNTKQTTNSKNNIELVKELINQAILNEKINNIQYEKDILEAQLMDFITPSPSSVNSIFNMLYSHDKKEALKFFYELSQNNNHIKTEDIKKNIHYYSKPSKYGELEITINLSKPEKDPKEIAMAKLIKNNNNYPICQLCFENEGYEGRIDYPAKTNHRIIRFNLNENETWGFQYSPYSYFNEHCIFLDKNHTPMKISKKTFEDLFSIVDKFPSYFVGSNADLPIVGGSILTHNHYQGGNHIFPMDKTNTLESVKFNNFDNVSAELLEWPLSVIRLKSESKDDLIELSNLILSKWKSYSDKENQIITFSNNENHHTITPIVRKIENIYQIDLVLRDNQTSEEYPDGIYHPHKNLHHIKKENIGLIEVMGLAILPPRLKQESEEVAQYLTDKNQEIKDYHKEWANELRSKYTNIQSKEESLNIVRESIGDKFIQVLEDAGVYKQTENGKKAFLNFIEYCNR